MSDSSRTKNTKTMLAVIKSPVSVKPLANSHRSPNKPITVGQRPPPISIDTGMTRAMT